MDLLKRSIILYVNQVRQENFNKLAGKGFSEAFSWRKQFKKIIFICYSSNNKYIFKKIYKNCFLIGIPFDLSSSTIKSILNIGKNYFNLFLFIFRLSRCVKIDIIRMENLLLSGPSIFLISKMLKIPYIIWLGGFERKALVFKYGNNYFTWILAKLIILYEKIILKNANFVFPVTDGLMELAEERNVKNKILSPNYVNLSLFRDNRLDDQRNSQETIKLLYVGRFEEEKGIKVLLNSIKIISDEKGNVELLMVGDGSLKEWVVNFINNHNLKNVKFLGMFDHKEMPNIYNSADLFILPSYTEGSPASLIEAMSCGTASIASEVGECKKLIKNGYNGILIPPGDPNKLAEAISSLIEDRKKLDEFRERGRKSIVNYTLNYSKIHKYVYDQILKIYYS